MFRRFWRTKHFSAATKPFSACGADVRKQRLVIRLPTNGGNADSTGDGQMRTISFILALAFVLAGSSIAGSSDNGLPGVGTFSYNGSPMVPAAPQTIVVAAN
jgi:hypothetical protein